MSRLTIRDLCDLFRRYVPAASRHTSASSGDGPLWWPAHELGHLLTVPPRAIGLPMFGLDDDADPDQLCVPERRCRELAAMSVSYRLLVACGRPDLADQEREDTDHETMEYSWEDHARRRVPEILREHGCLRIPRSREVLETKLRHAIARAHPGASSPAAADTRVARYPRRPLQPDAELLERDRALVGAGVLARRSQEIVP
jgi:hypothetical protein